MTEKVQRVSKQIFPSLHVKVWNNKKRNEKYGHLQYTLMDARNRKIIDLSGHIIQKDHTHIKSGFGTSCGKYNTNKGWPCTEYSISDIFPLQKCFVIGVSTPCPRNLVDYLTQNNQREYIDDGFSGQRCHGCTKCLLWNRKNKGNLNAINKTVRNMKELDNCGFGTLSELKIVQKEGQIKCERERQIG